MDDAQRWHVTIAMWNHDTKERCYLMSGPCWAIQPEFCSGAKMAALNLELAQFQARLAMAIPVLDVLARLSMHMYRVRP